MPSSAENARARVKQWRKENPELYREQRKRYRVKHAKANYEKVKKWRKENPELRKAQKQRERSRVKKSSQPENLLTSPLTDLQCSKETELLVDHIVEHVPLEIIKFDCAEVLDGPSSTVDELLFDTPFDQVLNDFDLSLFDR